MPDSTPTLDGFTAFCRGPAGIPTDAMPDGDEGFSDALFYAQRWVPCMLNCVDCYLYTLCVYNLGVHLVLVYQQDQAGQTYFTALRAAYKVNNFVAGVVSSSADEGTSVSLTVGTQLSNLSAFDLSLMSDPFGRRALEIIGELGLPEWGLS